MNYHVVVDGRETGPFPPAALNRMRRKGEIRGEQLCRLENGTELRRLDEVFRHFAPSQEVVAEARKNVARWNVDAGTSSISVGAVMAGGGLLRTVLTMDLRGVAFIIVGIGLLVNGYAQRRRGELARQAQVRSTTSTPASSADHSLAQTPLPTEGERATPPSQPTGRYDY